MPCNRQPLAIVYGKYAAAQLRNYGLKKHVRRQPVGRTAVQDDARNYDSDHKARQI